MMLRLDDITTVVRLDTSRTKGLCGYQLYNGTFCDGRIVTVDGNTVTFGPGWVHDADGMWRESRNSHRRRQRGYPAKYRTNPVRQMSNEMRNELTDEGWVVQVARAPLNPREYVVCPHCRRPQVLDVGQLTAASVGRGTTGRVQLIGNPDDESRWAKPHAGR
jgi:uncharacterized protein RhaS with RHS repeats